MYFMVWRSRITADEAAIALLDRTRLWLEDAYTHQACPFEDIVEALNPIRKPNESPLFSVDFLFQYEKRFPATSGPV